MEPLCRVLLAKPQIEPVNPLENKSLRGQRPESRTEMKTIPVSTLGTGDPNVG